MRCALILFTIINLLLALLGIKEFRRFKRSEEYKCKKEFRFRTLMFLGFGAMKLLRFKKYRGTVFEIYRHKFGGIEKTIDYYRAYISNMVTACISLFDIIAGFVVAYIYIRGVDEEVFYFGILGVVAIVAIVYGQYHQNLSEERNRTDNIICELPNVVNKIAVLQASGLPMEMVLQRVAKENRSESNPVYNELQIVAADISNGKGAVKAMQSMQQRCKKPEISRFVSAIVQNLTHGTSDCAQMLEMLANDMWRTRRSLDKIRGQKIKEMMLIPTIICFVVVMVIVITPAFIGLDRFV